MELNQFKNPMKQEKKFTYLLKSNKKGITLIALIVTIIVLLILAGIVISLTVGQNGVMTKAQESGVAYKEQEAREKLELVLLDLQTDKRTDASYNENEYINTRLQENDMIVNGDIVFVDGWQFRIDRSVPQIAMALGKEKVILINTSYVGTASFTTKIYYIYNEAEIDSYSYVIDDIEITGLEKEYTKEDLEAETTHTVKVIARYKNGEVLESNKITLKLEPRTYLYKNGDHCVDITGGWKSEIFSYNQVYTDSNIQWFKGNGNYSSGTYQENSDNIYMTSTHSGTTRYGETRISMVTNNLIDFTTYKKIGVDLVFNTNWNAYYRVERRNEQGQTGVIDLNSDLNLSEKQFLLISLYSSATRTTTGNLTIKSVWLEK